MGAVSQPLKELPFEGHNAKFVKGRTLYAWERVLLCPETCEGKRDARDQTNVSAIFVRLLPCNTMTYDLTTPANFSPVYIDVMILLQTAPSYIWEIKG
jgi:hypothetical protein